VPRASVRSALVQRAELLGEERTYIRFCAIAVIKLCELHEALHSLNLTVYYRVLSPTSVPTLSNSFDSAVLCFHSSSFCRLSFVRMYSETGSPLSLARFRNSRHSARVSRIGITRERTFEGGFGGLPIRILIVYHKVCRGCQAGCWETDVRSLNSTCTSSANQACGLFPTTTVIHTRWPKDA
jgi:hypothetical protein